MASNTKVLVVKHGYQADHKAFLVDKKCEEKNAEIIAHGELVHHADQGVIKVLIVPHEYQADIMIMREDFPS